MPYTPEEQRIVDHIDERLEDMLEWKDSIPHGMYYLASVELKWLKEILEDIKATRDKEYPCDRKGD